MVVEPNVVGIARRNAQVRVPEFAGNPETIFQRVTFEPRTGFTLDDDGNIIVDDDPAAVGYYWYGRNGFDHLFLTVRLGRVRAMVYGPSIRYGLSTEGARTIFRDVDAAGADESGCATNAIAALVEAEVRGIAHAAPKDEVPLDDAQPNASAPPPTTKPGVAAAKHSARVGVLFYYTSEAENFRVDPSIPNSPPLGVAGLQDLAGAWIDQMNTTLRNSGDTYYLTFEQLGSVTPLPGYTELTQTQQPDPNQRASFHLFSTRQHETFSPPVWRATVGADFAVLLVADSGNPGGTRVWGAAYVQRNNCIFDNLCEVGDGTFPVPGARTYRNYAYAALTVNPAAQNLTFSHEMGHLLGSNQDPNIAFPLAGPAAPLGLRGAYVYSYGYRAPTVARDVMSDPECIDDDGPGMGTSTTCTGNRQPQFSNPRVVFMGTGIASGSATADATRTITCLAEPSGNLYPLGSTLTSPNLFWSGFEAPGLSTSTCGTRLLW